MKKILISLIVAFVMITSTGCVSRMVHNSWAEAKQKQAIRVEADGQQVMVGVDVTALAYIKENPVAATLAAIADAGLAYGAYRLGQEVFNSNDSSSHQRNNSVDVSGNQNSSININISGDQDNDPVNHNDTSNNSYQ